MNENNTKDLTFLPVGSVSIAVVVSILAFSPKICLYNPST